MNQDRLHFLLWPSAYQMNQGKVRLVISLLTGEVLDWVSHLPLQDHPILASWDTFL